MSRAVADTRRAIGLLERLRSGARDRLYELACCHAALTVFAGHKGSGIPARDGEVEAVNAMDLLRSAVASGYRDARAMATEVALDPLRKRSDFRLLMFDQVFTEEPFAL